MTNKLQDHIPDFSANSWLSLGSLLSSRKVTVAKLATAIENDGIYTWDRFGRFSLANEEDKMKALDLLAEMYSRPGSSVPLEIHDEQADSTFLFGWAGAVCPDFETIQDSNPKPPLRKSAETNSRRTLLIIIAALAKKANIDLDERGSARKIMELTDEIGAHISDETIRKLKTEIVDAVESRMK